VALIAIVLVTSLDFLQRIVNTTALSFTQWCVCAGIAASIVVVEELIKLVIRHQGSSDESTTQLQLTSAVPA
jgi:Ca2+-transporting ATPase